MGFIRKIILQTAGNSNGRVQSFASNNFVLTDYPKIKPFSFDLPTYLQIGGTIDYYGQDPYSIFTSLSEPFIRYNFTGNTYSLSGDTLIIHEVYKLKYDLYQKYNLNYQLQNAIQQVNNSLSTQTETTVQDGVTSIKTTTLSGTNQTNSEISQRLGEDLLGIIKFYLTNPVLIVSASTSAITSNYYEFIPPSVIKPIDDSNNLRPSEFLFEDKSQYFIRTYFRITKETLDGYEDLNRIISGSVLTNDLTISAQTFNNPEYLMTAYDFHTITASTFSGITIAGNYFSYFKVPNKPLLEEPYVQDQLSTLSPKFYFSNVDDGDEYQLDVVYNASDTGFTGTVYTSMINKNLVDGIQYYSTALKTNSQFRYRIGNVKTLKDIFGVEQKVVTFSDSLTAITQTTPASVHVFSSSDSPYVVDVPVLITPPNLVYESSSNYYSLSGVVSGSIVTGATVTLLYPNGNTVTQTTTLTGFYSFTGLTSGSYTISTNYRGYLTDSKNITLTADTANSFKMKLLWGDSVDTWGKMGSENFFI